MNTVKALFTVKLFVVGALVLIQFNTKYMFLSISFIREKHINTDLIVCLFVYSSSTKQRKDQFDY